MTLSTQSQVLLAFPQEMEIKMFELLMSADMMVPDPDGMTELLVDKLGIYKHERWRQAFDDHPYIAHFLRVHKSLAVSPTRVEPQWHLDRPNPGDPMFHDFLESLKEYQGRHRPMLTHSIVLSLHGDKFDALVSKLMRRKLPFRMAQRTPDMPYGSRLRINLLTNASNLMRRR